MKRFFKVLSLAVVAFMALSCYDDTKVWEEINSIKADVAKINDQVKAMSSILDVLQSGDYIKTVTPLADGGYKIEFAKADPVIIRDGQKGQDGAAAPQIGVMKDVDGLYYWTLGGEWLLDSSNNKILAAKSKPEIKNEGGKWYISADGSKWDLIGPDVDCTFKNVAVTEDAVTFTLANGQEIVIPFVKALDITFDVVDGSAFSEKLKVNYTITGGTENNRVAVMGNGVVAKVEPASATAGTITSDALELGSYEITVFVTDGVSKTIFKTLKFAVGKLTVEENIIYVNQDATEVTIPVITSVDYNVVPDAAWITLPAATKAEIREDQVVVNIAANEAMTSRTGYVDFVPVDESCAAMAMSVAIVQKGHANKAWTVKVKEIEGYDAAKKVRLAKYGDKLLLANTTKVFMINPLTGEVEATIPMPEGVVAHSVVVDDAGNFMIAADAGVGAEMTLYYVADPMNPAPEVVLTYNTGNYYGTDTGNIRVRGNIKANATITATVSAGAGGAMLYWSVVDGVCGDWKWASIPYAAGEVAYACAAPAGTDVAAGFFYIGYQGDYNLKYAATPNAGSTEWVTSFVTGSSWMENYNSIATAEWKGNKYAAILKGCHFNYDDAEMLLLNVNNPAAAELVYEYSGTYDVTRSDAWANLDWTGSGAYSDILLVPTEDALLMVGVDSNYGTLTCVTIE